MHVKIISTAINSTENRSLMSSDIIVNQQHDQPRRPIHQVFHGVFQLWAKPRLPPDIASVALVAGDPSDSDSGAINAVVVPDCAIAAADAAHVAGFEPNDGFLRSCLSSVVCGDEAGQEGQAVHRAGHPVVPNGSGNGADAAVIAKKEANPGSPPGSDVVQIMQQMQHLCPRMSVYVRVCPLSEVSGQTRIAA